MVEGTDMATPRPVDPELLRSRTVSRRPLDTIVYGTPEEVAQRITADAADAPVDTVFFWASIAGMPEEMVARHIRTICDRLAPLLADDNSTSPPASNP